MKSIQHHCRLDSSTSGRTDSSLQYSVYMFITGECRWTIAEWIYSDCEILCEDRGWLGWRLNASWGCQKTSTTWAAASERCKHYRPRITKLLCLDEKVLTITKYKILLWPFKDSVVTGLLLDCNIHASYLMLLRLLSICSISILKLSLLSMKCLCILLTCEGLTWGPSERVSSTIKNEKVKC